MAMKMTHISKTLLSIVCTLWGMSACSDDYNKYDDCPACNYYPVAPAMMVQRLKIGKI